MRVWLRTLILFVVYVLPFALCTALSFTYEMEHWVVYQYSRNVMKDYPVRDIFNFGIVLELFWVLFVSCFVAEPIMDVKPCRKKTNN